jgi:hypothetical protein
MPKSAIKLFIALFALALLATGCATVQSKVTVFHKLPALAEGKTIAILPVDKDNEGSLEFKSHAGHIAERLSAKGYRVVEPSEQPEYYAFVAYWIDKGKPYSYNLPMYVQTGGGITYHSGTVTTSSGPKTFTGYTYSVPTYVMIPNRESGIKYTKRLLVDIVEGKPYRDGKTVKVYEGKVINADSSEILSQAVAFMIDALFADFPGKSGRTHTVTAPLNER